MIARIHRMPRWVRRMALAAALAQRPRVFIAHGTDHARRNEVARLLKKHGATPIILDQQVNAGRTILDKLEAYALTAQHAIVLATADDLGGARAEPPDK